MSSIINDERVQLSKKRDFNKIDSWEDGDLDLKNNLLRSIYAFGFEKPSPIQKKAIMPIVKTNYDIIAQAQSGTGKTGAFAVSVLQKFDENSNKASALVLAPTHELAGQIKLVFDSLGKYLKVRTLLLVGGTSVEENKKALLDEKNKPQILIGTPGRIHDMLRRKYIKSSDLNMLIIDEADEMLSSGFKDQMYKIFQYMPEEIQIGLFSATMPDELEELTKQFLRNPIKLLVKADQLTLAGIAQFYIKLANDGEKYDCIKDLFGGLSVSQSIIYCNSCSRVDDLEEAMLGDNFPVSKIHGKMPEDIRKKTYQSFKDGECRVLITSDLFARGIDVQQVSIVINFDLPRSKHTYLHRIGRSGRWGRKGIAINFITRHDTLTLARFEAHYETEIKEMPMNFTEHLGALC